MDPSQKAKQHCFADLIDLARGKRLLLQFMRRFGRVFATARAQTLSYGAMYSLHFEWYTAMLPVYGERKTCPDP